MVKYHGFTKYINDRKSCWITKTILEFSAVTSSNFLRIWVYNNDLIGVSILQPNIHKTVKSVDNFAEYLLYP